MAKQLKQEMICWFWCFSARSSHSHS